MAGIGILLANLWLGVVIFATLIAVLFFLISFILLILHKKNKDRKSGKIVTKKRIAVVLAILGVICLFPLGITLTAGILFSGKEEAKRREYIESIDHKITVQGDEWRTGFTYDGKELVPVNFLMDDDRFELEYLGALVVENTDQYYSFYQIVNGSGYGMYYVKVTAFAGGDYYSRTFVDKQDFDAVVDYYDNSEIVISAIWKTAPDNGLRTTWKRLQYSLDDRRGELFSLAHEVLDDISDKRITNTSRRGDYDQIEFVLYSDDGVCKIELCIYAKDEEMILFVNEYLVDEEIAAKYKDMLFALIRDAETELLQSTSV